MERGTTFFLRMTVIIIGLLILALCIMGLPLIIKEAADFFPPVWVYSAAAGMYGSAIPFFLALYQSLRLLSFIDKNIAFSESAVHALRNIKYCAFAISILYVVCEPFLFLMAEFDDAPGIIVIGLVIIFASMVIGVFAAVLQKLLKHAIDIKSENDLTV